MTTRRPVHSRSGRPEYPSLKNEHGEDPARYLHDLDMTAFARIRGIHDPDVLDAWYTVEEDLGPRKRVIRALNARRRALDDGGRGE